MNFQIFYRESKCPPEKIRNWNMAENLKPHISEAFKNITISVKYAEISKARGQYYCSTTTADRQ